MPAGCSLKFFRFLSDARHQIRAFGRIDFATKKRGKQPQLRNDKSLKPHSQGAYNRPADRLCRLFLKSAHFWGAGSGQLRGEQLQ
jgi:hypothetical protein